MAFTKQEQAWIDQKIPLVKEVDFDYLGLDQIVEAFTDFADEHGIDISEIKVDIEVDQGYYGDSASYSSYLRAHRGPNDKERQDRIDKIMSDKARQTEARRRERQNKEASERKEYERLHKKFGPRAGFTAAE